MMAAAAVSSPKLEIPSRALDRARDRIRILPTLVPIVLVLGKRYRGCTIQYVNTIELNGGY
jgi:hypothetical protein